MRSRRHAAVPAALCTLAAGVIVVSAVACSQQAVERVVDGDTLQITFAKPLYLLGASEKVRLLGVDTPELGSSEPYAREAQGYAEDILCGAAVPAWHMSSASSTRATRNTSRSAAAWIGRSV